MPINKKVNKIIKKVKLKKKKKPIRDERYSPRELSQSLISPAKEYQHTVNNTTSGFDSVLPPHPYMQAAPMQ